MSKNSIELSPKHGLNPCIPVCFFCGKEKNEIALLGHIGDRRKGEDIPAPVNAVLNYEPCDECKEKFAKGVLLIEVTISPKATKMPIAFKAYPTGRFVVVKPEALNGDYKAGSSALIYQTDFTAMFGHLM